MDNEESQTRRWTHVSHNVTYTLAGQRGRKNTWDEETISHRTKKVREHAKGIGSDKKMIRQGERAGRIERVWLEKTRERVKWRDRRVSWPS